MSTSRKGRGASAPTPSISIHDRPGRPETFPWGEVDDAMRHVRNARVSLKKLTAYGYFTASELGKLLAKLHAAECSLKEVGRG